MSLDGEEVKTFRESHLKTEPPKSLAALLNSLTPPQGVVRTEGFELFDAEEGELDIMGVETEVLDEELSVPVLPPPNEPPTNTVQYL